MELPDGDFNLANKDGQHMKILELFAGTRVISDAFAARGHETFSVDWNRDLGGMDLYCDIGKLSKDEILEGFGRPDVIWASPDCATFSVAALGHHRDGIVPKTDYARLCDEVDDHVVDLILALNPKYWFVENPRAMMRKMPFIERLCRDGNGKRYTITFCKYGETRMKPTDIWTNHPDPKFIPACKNGDPCHERAPRGSRAGTQGIKGAKDRGRIPDLLCKHIVDICENG